MKLWFGLTILLLAFLCAYALVVPPSERVYASEPAPTPCEPWGQYVYPKQPGLWETGC